MISPLETIQRRYAKSLDADTQSLLQTMHSNGLRLLKLINDLLDLVRLDSGVLQVRREAIRLEDFLRGLASSASQIASDKKIKLITTVAPGLNAIMADRDKMEKIILNLQFNALKFTPAGGRIEISASCEGQDFRPSCQRHRHRYSRQEFTQHVRTILPGGQLLAPEVSRRRHWPGAG